MRGDCFELTTKAVELEQLPAVNPEFSRLICTLIWKRPNGGVSVNGFSEDVYCRRNAFRGGFRAVAIENRNADTERNFV